MGIKKPKQLLGRGGLLDWISGEISALVSQFLGAIMMLYPSIGSVYKILEITQERFGGLGPIPKS